MRILLSALLLVAACGSGLVDHAGARLLPDRTGLCAAPRRNCDGFCVVEDVNNCGGCGRTCSVAHASNRCDAGACKFTCDAGFFDCAGSCCPASSLATGGDTTCAVVASSVRCWGSNDSGQLGSPPSGAQWSATPITIPGLATATSVSVGEHHACAILAGTGAVACWGANGSGQATAPAALSGVRSLALGGRHSCARRDTTVTCWGANDFGQLGGGTVPLPAGVTSIAAGRDFSCATASGTLYCWGKNDFGQLGDPQTTAPFTSTPVDVRDVSNAQFVAAGANHACAIGSDFWCWGANSFGQVGDGKQEPIANPTKVGVQSPSLAAAGSAHTCAVGLQGELYCWGSNDFGQLGLGVSSVVPELTPVAVPARPAVHKLALGASHSCAQRPDGALLCWGNNASGQVGPPASGAILSPRLLPRPSN